MRRRLFLLAALAALPSLARASGGGGEKKTTGGTSYIPIRTLTGAVNKPGGRGVLSVECGLDVPDAGLRDRAEKSLPRLRAAYLQTVLSYAGGLPYRQVPNIEFLARTLQRQTDEMLGRTGARVLLGSVMVN